MDFSSSQFWISLVQIIWIDLLLSGDNAIVIALACRNLPPEQRRMGILLGAGAAIGLRILFAVIISYLLGIPFLKIVGGLLLFWIAVKLVQGDEGHGEIDGATTLWSAVKTIAIADAVMSLDNVLAVSAAAHGDIWLFSFGILLSIPMIIYGSNVILALLTRFPILVWIGAALLGWIAGDMITNDPQWIAYFGPWKGLMSYLGDTIGALIVLAAGFFLKWRNERAAKAASGA
ncbi:MAG: TerC family protein [Hyphomicrobiales bacterium]|nr:TerC family protein [Hyphomicrobiales bacterium]